MYHLTTFQRKGTFRGEHGNNVKSIMRNSSEGIPFFCEKFPVERSDPFDFLSGNVFSAQMESAQGHVICKGRILDSKEFFTVP